MEYGPVSGIQYGNTSTLPNKHQLRGVKQEKLLSSKTLDSTHMEAPLEKWIMMAIIRQIKLNPWSASITYITH